MPHCHGLHLVVGHIHRGGAQLTLELHDLGAGARAQLGIQIAEGFIHQKHIGLAGDGPAQGHPLLLAAGELLRQPLQQRFQLQHPCHLSDASINPLLPRRGHLQGGGPGAAEAMEAILELLGQGAVLTAPQAKTQVVGHREVGIERVALKHHRHIPLGGPEAAHGLACHIDLPTGGEIKTRQQAQQGALATPRGPHQHKKFPVGDGQIQLMQHGHGLPAPPGGIGLAHLCKPNLGQTCAPTGGS